MRLQKDYQKAYMKHKRNINFIYCIFHNYYLSICIYFLTFEKRERLYIENV